MPLHQSKKGNLRVGAATVGRSRVAMPLFILALAVALPAQQQQGSAAQAAPALEPLQDPSIFYPASNTSHKKKELKHGTAKKSAAGASTANANSTAPAASPEPDAAGGIYVVTDDGDGEENMDDNVANSGMEAVVDTEPAAGANGTADDAMARKAEQKAWEEAANKAEAKEEAPKHRRPISDGGVGAAAAAMGTAAATQAAAAAKAAEANAARPGTPQIPGYPQAPPSQQDNGVVVVGDLATETAEAAEKANKAFEDAAEAAVRNHDEEAARNAMDAAVASADAAEPRPVSIHTDDPGSCYTVLTTVNDLWCKATCAASCPTTHCDCDNVCTGEECNAKRKALH